MVAKRLVGLAIALACACQAASVRAQVEGAPGSDMVFYMPLPTGGPPTPPGEQHQVVPVHCTVTADHHLTGCEIEGGAGLSEMTRTRVIEWASAQPPWGHPQATSGDTITLRVATPGSVLSIAPVSRFPSTPANPTQSALPSGSVAHWVRKPDERDLQLARSLVASNARVEGRVVLTCQVLPSGVLYQCRTETENPTGMGFGAAAYILKDKFQIDTVQLKGRCTRNVCGDISIPIDFGISN